MIGFVQDGHIFVAASTDEMASRALHDPGVMGDVLRMIETH